MDDPEMDDPETDDSARSMTSRKCRLGWHTWLVVNDDNPEQPHNTHRECAHCSKIKDKTEFELEHSDSTWMNLCPGF